MNTITQSRQLVTPIERYPNSSYSLGVLYRLYDFVLIDTLENIRSETIKETPLLSKNKQLNNEISDSNFLKNFLAEIESGLIIKMSGSELNYFMRLFDFFIANFEPIFGANNAFQKELIISAVQVNINNYLITFVENLCLIDKEDLGVVSKKIEVLIKYLNKLQLQSGYYINLHQCLYTYLIKVLRSKITSNQLDIFISNELQPLLGHAASIACINFINVFNNAEKVEENDLLDLIRQLLSITSTLYQFKNQNIQYLLAYALDKDGYYVNFHGDYDFITDELIPSMNFRVKSLYGLYLTKFSSSKKLPLLNLYLAKQGLIF